MTWLSIKFFYHSSFIVFFVFIEFRGGSFFHSLVPKANYHVRKRLTVLLTFCLLSMILCHRGDIALFLLRWKLAHSFIRLSLPPSNFHYRLSFTFNAFFRAYNNTDAWIRIGAWGRWWSSPSHKNPHGRKQ